MYPESTCQLKGVGFDRREEDKCEFAERNVAMGPDVERRNNQSYSERWRTSIKVPLEAGATALAGLGLGKVRVPEVSPGGEQIPATSVRKKKRVQR